MSTRIARIEEVDVALEPFEPAQVRGGAPRAGWHPLARFGDHEVGVWEMTEGAATDVEGDEVFLVLSGRARIDFVEPPRTSLELTAGDIVRLTAGDRTVWTVTQTLRKIAFT